MNILVPMAGEGSRFKQAGYDLPKPFINVKGKPMIEWVIESMPKGHFIFLVRKEHLKYDATFKLRSLAPGCEIIIVDSLTEGAACTSLLAKPFINNNRPLLITNSDQFVIWNSDAGLLNKDLAGVIYTFKSFDPKFSFARTNDDGYVVEVAEKKPISHNATCGIYYWNKGSTYVRCAEQMIKKNIRVNNEFYICPVYNELDLPNDKVAISEVRKMNCLGTPEELDKFLKS